MDDAKTVWCGNLSDQVTEELLFELFLQAAPLEKVRIPTDREGRKSNFAFITFKHPISVNYVLKLLNGTRLFDKSINVKPRNINSQNQPVDRNIPRIDFQNSLNQTINYNDLFRMGQLIQHNYESSHSYNDNRQGYWEHNNYHERDDRRDSQKTYKKHEYHDKRRNDSPNQRRNHYNDRRNNFTDRNNRRNSRHYY
ncbi:hypothetical protein NQ314_012402 [Rhamnusium bicolor]|uniref:RRM domain-containing protein n=1 Tax=Rhamnusium bicolor TaxID=1586634 RepID=A0AAV8XBF7_9CUCU|nr:hypothetical protein NQ314_012402 [Rhamnusium bicolor]